MRDRFLAAVLLVSLTGLRGALAEDKPISILGANVLQPILGGLVDEYSKTVKGVKFAVEGGGSSFGIKSVATGLAVLGMSSRELSKKEREDFPDLVVHTVAYDALVLIVHESNPLSTLTAAQVKDIYTGKITRWKEIGGADKEILLFGRTPQQATCDLFHESFGLEGQVSGTFMLHKPKGADAFAEAKTRMFNVFQEGIAQLAGEPRSIFYGGRGSVEVLRKKGMPIKVVGLDGVEPSSESLASGGYKLRQYVNLITKGAPEGEAKKFLAWLAGDEGKKKLASLGVIPVE